MTAVLPSFTLDLKNYRSYAAPAVASIQFRPGLIALVGPNNAGKTNLLRFLFEFRHAFEMLGREFNVGPNLWTALQSGSLQINLQNTPDADAVFTNTNDGDLECILRPDVVPAPQGESVKVITPTALRLTFDRSTKCLGLSLRVGEDGYLIGNLEQAPPLYGLAAGHVGHPYLADNFLDVRPFRDICRLLSSSTYIGTFRNIINQGSGPYYDLTVGDALVGQWGAAQTGGNVAQSRAIASIVKELETTFELDRLEVLPSNDRKSLMTYINRRPLMLSELGSGFSQFLITLFNLELRATQLTLIDEPELGLHPRLQLDFLTAVARRSAYGVLYTTHSLGLARSLSDSVYSVYVSQGHSRVRRFEDLRNPIELLGELSYAGAADMGLDTVLLVEGPTEIKVFRAILQKLRAANRVTMVSLGGDSGIAEASAHALIDLRTLSKRVFALIDSERSNDQVRARPERLAFARNCENAGIQCHLLERRCTESYFSDQAVKKVQGSRFSALAEFEEVPNGWSKNLNWKVADAMDINDFTGPDLVDFLRLVSANE